MSDPAFDLRDAAVATLHFGYDQENWHPALAQAVEGVSAERAAWRPEGGHNSIHDIVRHLVHWKRAALDDFRALASREAFDAYAAQDWPHGPSDAASWERDVAALHEVSRALLAKVEAQDADALAAVPEGGRRPRAVNVLNLATHDAYHAGQIRLLRVLQGI